jgi:hypothetical protein
LRGRGSFEFCKSLDNVKIKDTQSAWDDRKLGAEAEFVGVADTSHEEILQDALECYMLQRFVAPNVKRLDDDVQPLTTL